MYAIIQTGGKQYRVQPGDVIRIDSLKSEPGAKGLLSPVLAVATDSGELLTGGQAAAAKVEATVLRHARARKVIVFHYKRKKQYKKTRGHRQNFTEVRIESVTI